MPRVTLFLATATTVLVALTSGCKQERELVGLNVTKEDVGKWGGTTALVGTSKVEGDIEMTVYEGGAYMRGANPAEGDRPIGQSHKRIVRSKKGKVVEVTIMYDARLVREDDDAYNAFFILVNALAKQAANIDVAKDDNAYEKLGLENPAGEGTSVLKVNDNVTLVRKVSYGTLKFSAVVPGYSERS